MPKCVQGAFRDLLGTGILDERLVACWLLQLNARLGKGFPGQDQHWFEAANQCCPLSARVSLISIPKQQILVPDGAAGTSSPSLGLVKSGAGGKERSGPGSKHCRNNASSEILQFAGTAAV